MTEQPSVWITKDKRTGEIVHFTLIAATKAEADQHITTMVAPHFFVSVEYRRVEKETER